MKRFFLCCGCKDQYLFAQALSKAVRAHAQIRARGLYVHQGCGGMLRHRLFMKNRSCWLARTMPWLRSLLLMALLLGCFHLSACSTQQPTPPAELAGNANDLFNDPFFTDPSYWDNPNSSPDNQLAEKPKEPEKPKSLLQKSGDLAFTTFVVGVSIAKMAIPFVGF